MKSNYFKLMFLLSKRLFKKVSFVIILCLIPIIALSFKMLSDEESGIVRIALCNEGNDRDAERVVDSLLNRSSVFLYTEVEDSDEAEELIRDGVVDGAWIFPKDYGNRIDDYTKGLIDNSNKTENVVTVYQSEDSILLNLSRMELFGALYSDLSYSLYDNYINIKIMDGSADERELRQYYKNNAISGSIFRMGTLDDDEYEDTDERTNYLLSPIRGILLLVVLLTGMAAAMYYRDDSDKEIFDWMPVGNMWVFEHIYIITALIYGAIVVLITFFLTGISKNPLRDIVMMPLYVLMCAVFSSILRKITRTLKSLATAIPILLIAMLVICPVFIYISSLRILQYLLPPFYYLMSANNASYILYGVLYLLVTIVVDVLLSFGSRCSS